MLQSEPSAALTLRGIRKTFGPVTAVDGVDLELFPGEVHALVGENGAGKSTLSAIAYGELQPDAGTIERAGRVGLVHQHFELIGRLRVWENVLLGREPRNGMQIDEARAKEAVQQLAQRNGLHVDPDAVVESLPVGAAQRVELLRELDRNPSVLLLDEPTAALAPAEIEAFFATVLALARAGTAVLVVTHKLQEVLDYTDRVTVMRRGRIVARLQTAQTHVDEIARAMVGDEIPSVATRVATEKTPLVIVRDASAQSGDSTMHDVTLNVASGEIVGVAGVEGNGQTALADALCGIVPYGGEIQRPKTIGVIPQDRHREALVMSWSLVENVLLGRQHRPKARAHARSDAQRIVEDLDIRAASIDVPVRTLSGGNQQKLVVGRALIDSPSFVLAYNPTRGIDVGAAALVQSRLIQARNDGAAILLISFELDELFALADRIYVMYRGAITGELARAPFDRGTIGAMMAGSR